MIVGELWRYPVKSMLGESLERAHVSSAGIVGDRRYGVVDAASGVTLSAKRYAVLLACRSWTAGGDVSIALPDGSEYPAQSEEVSAALSELIGRQVLIGSAADADSIRHEFPTDVAAGLGETFVWEPGLDGFHDLSPLHLVTSATLAELSRLNPESAFTRARFRPNILAEVPGDGFIEDGWVGRRLQVGAVGLEIAAQTYRCVMTTRGQSKLPDDAAVLETVTGANGGNVGVGLGAEAGGIISVGDPLTLT